MTLRVSPQAGVSMKPRPFLHMTDSRDMASPKQHHPLCHSRSLLTLETCLSFRLHEIHDLPDFRPTQARTQTPEFAWTTTVLSSYFQTSWLTTSNISHFIVKISHENLLKQSFPDNKYSNHLKNQLKYTILPSRSP